MKNAFDGFVSHLFLSFCIIIFSINSGKRLKQEKNVMIGSLVVCVS